jgi:hypothetical protein
MSINQRKHIRLTLDIPVYRFTEAGDKIGIMIYQISIGGCFIEWDESIGKNDEFRMEIQLPNKNWLPLQCRAIYLVRGDGIGVQFEDITQFEQELLAQIMSISLAKEGIPVAFDPFSKPKKFFDSSKMNEEMLEKVLIHD